MPSFDAPAQIDFELVRGDTASKKFVVTINGAAIDVSAGTMHFYGTDDEDTPNEIGPITCTVGGGGNNEITVPFTPTDTDTLTVYDYDIQQTDGSDRYTYAIGKLTIVEDVNTA